MINQHRLGCGNVGLIVPGQTCACAKEGFAADEGLIIVTLRGGPMDGHAVTVPAGCKHLRVPQRVVQPWDCLPQPREFQWLIYSPSNDNPYIWELDK